MKSRRVTAIIVSAVLSLSLATHAGAADARSSPRATPGWLDRIIEWVVKTVQPVSGLWEEEKGLPGGTGGGANLDGGGCLDPFGRPLCG